MVRASLLTKQKEAAAAAAAAAIPVITEVSVQEDRARVQSDLQGSMKALTGSPPSTTFPLETRVVLRTPSYSGTRWSVASGSATT